MITKEKKLAYIFLLSRISNYETRTKRESSNMTHEKKSLATPDHRGTFTSQICLKQN